MFHTTNRACTSRSTSGTSGSRTRWAAVGAAVAVTLGAAGIGGINIARADLNAGDRTVLVSIDPCRLADTRSGAENVGPRSIPLRADETHTFNARQAGVPCSGQVPAAASSLLLNVTAVNATAVSFLTFWPDGSRPKVSSLNPAPGQAPAPNAVTVKLSGTDTFEAFNNAGSVDVIVDIVGYYENHTHDDRYYTQLQVQDIVAQAISTLPGSGGGDELLRADPADFAIARTTRDSNANTVAATGWSMGGSLFHDGTPNSECVYAPIRAAAGTTVTSITVRYTSAAGTTNGSVSLTGFTTTPGPANFGTTGFSTLANDPNVEFFSDGNGVIRTVDVAPTGTPSFVAGHVNTLSLCTADNALAILTVIVNTA